MKERKEAKLEMDHIVLSTCIVGIGIDIPRY